jgi:pectate lyase
VDLQSQRKSEDQARLDRVIEFAKNVLMHGRDRYRKDPTPLFADGINILNGEHVRWRTPGKAPVISDLACQQNLFRTLNTLTILTGDPKYKNAAQAAIQYHFDHLVDSSGLLQWGGHRFIDLETLETAGTEGKGLLHELKGAFPYYELMFQADAGATVRYVEAFWNAHILDWDGLFVSRHGKYGLPVSDPWAHPRVNLPVFRESPGLSFINAGSDLIYAAGTIYRLTHDQRALAWAKHLAFQYVRARNPKTGLGAYQFTQSKKTQEPPSDTATFSWYGDRAKRQFGPEFGEIALEANVLLERQSRFLYGKNALMQIELAKAIGEQAAELLEWTRQGLVSFAAHAYIPETNMFRPMFTDGTDLSNYALKRRGYYDREGPVLRQYPATSRFLLAFMRAHLATHDEELWQIARNIARANGLGYLGSAPGKGLSLKLNSNSKDARALFALVDLFNATENPEYLQLGRVIGNNIVKAYFHGGYFTWGQTYINAQFDMIEPFALLTLQAAIEGKAEAAPTFIDGNAYVDGGYELADGTIKNTTDQIIYSQQI